MSDMFTNYENLSSTYVPDNRYKKIEKQLILDYKLPKEIYDDNNELIGFTWGYGDVVTIRYNANRPIYVENNAIIYGASDMPSNNTVGIRGQKAYNFDTRQCWICESLDTNIYNWVELPELIFPENGSEKIYIQPPYDLHRMKAIVSIKNFRHEEIYSKEYDKLQDGALSIDIDKELSSKLIQGIYYLYVILKNELEDNQRVDRKYKLIVTDSTKDIVGEDEYVYR